ncbi:hypothetical protein ACLOJK_027605, partial [Asimina triloba]
LHIVPVERGSFLHGEAEAEMKLRSPSSRRHFLWVGSKSTKAVKEAGAETELHPPSSRWHFLWVGSKSAKAVGEAEAETKLRCPAK